MTARKVIPFFCLWQIFLCSVYTLNFYFKSFIYSSCELRPVISKMAHLVCLQTKMKCGFSCLWNRRVRSDHSRCIWVHFEMSGVNMRRALAHLWLDFMGHVLMQGLNVLNHSQVRPAVWRLLSSWNRVMQPDNDSQRKQENVRQKNRTRESIDMHDLIKVQTSASFKCCGMTLKSCAWMHANQNKGFEDLRPKFLHNDVSSW